MSLYRCSVYGLPLQTGRYVKSNFLCFGTVVGNPGTNTWNTAKERRRKPHLIVGKEFVALLFVCLIDLAARISVQALLRGSLLVLTLWYSFICWGLGTSAQRPISCFREYLAGGPRACMQWRVDTLALCAHRGALRRDGGSKPNGSRRRWYRQKCGPPEWSSGMRVRLRPRFLRVLSPAVVSDVCYHCLYWRGCDGKFWDMEVSRSLTRRG